MSEDYSPTPQEEAEQRVLRLALRASYGFPAAVETFVNEPDIPDWLWRVVMRNATSNLFRKIPKLARERYLKYLSKRETRGRPRKLDDTEFLGAVKTLRDSGLSKTKAVSQAIDDHNQRHHERHVQDQRTGNDVLKRARRSGIK